MMETLVAFAAALYTAGLAVREAERVAARDGLVPPARVPGVAELPATTVLEPAISVMRSRPDPDRLIQTEVVVPVGPRIAASAFGRLAAGVAAAGLLLALSILGAARGIDLLFRKLSGG